MIITKPFHVATDLALVPRADRSAAVITVNVTRTAMTAFSPDIVQHNNNRVNRLGVYLACNRRSRAKKSNQKIKNERKTKVTQGVHDMMEIQRVKRTRLGVKGIHDLPMSSLIIESFGWPKVKRRCEVP